MMKQMHTVFQDRTLVGRPDAGSEPNDIQLSGVGIEMHHSVLCIENGDLFIEPYPNARTCVNGSQVRFLSPLKTFKNFTDKVTKISLQLYLCCMHPG